MVCPHCRVDTTDVNGLCAKCGRTLFPQIDTDEASVTAPPSRSASSPNPASPFVGPLGTGQAFGPRYHVIKALGAGGMGAVYQAWDEELGVAVALKVIRPDLGTDDASAAEAERRFKRELLLARQVTHKNVVRIHDLGEVDGIKYITMPYVEGRDLAAVLKSSGRLPIPNALAIAKQIVAGLEAAHEVGIVHRDLKPANIMIDEDRALIMDFGIARSVGGVGETIAAGGTAAGAVVGTLEYMAPEQARGEPADQRADIYAFGLMLCDMVAGRRHASASDSALAEFMRRIVTAPSPRSIDPSIPEPLDQLITRCVQPDPGARYQTTAELSADLDRLGPDGRLRADAPPSPTVDAPAPAAATVVAATVIAPAVRPRAPWVAWATAAVALAGAAGIAIMWRASAVRRADVAPTAAQAAATPAATTSLAILPFRNASSDAATDWLGPSLAEMLRTEIGQSAHLRSISADRIGQIQRDLHIAPDVDLDSGALRRLAEFSNAETILWGQYAKLGDAIRVDARLEDVKRQRSTPFKVEAANQSGVFAAVAGLAQSIRQNLSLPPDIVKELEQQSFKPSTQSLDALRHYNEGLELARQGKHADAQKAFLASTDSDKAFALAYARLGQSYASLGYDDDAQRASRRAVELSDSLPPQERYLVLASHARIVNDNAKAIESYENLAKVAPEDPDVHFNLASLYEAVGSFDNARAHYQKVLASDPNNAEALFGQGRVEIQRRNPQGALESLTRALTLAVQFENDETKANVLNAIGVAYKRLNKPDEALRYYQQSLDIKRARGDKRGLGLTLGEMAQVYTSLGKPDLALANYTEALRLNRAIGYQKGIGTTLINFGRLQSDRAHYDEALRMYKEALQIERELGDQNYQALCLDNIGGIYTFKGEFDDARTYFERALELREALKVPGNIADTVHNLAETSTRIGNYDEALKQYLRALQLRRDAGDKRGAAIESYSLGTVFEQQGAYGAALKSKEEALKAFRDLQDRSFWLAEILSGYGHALGLAGRNADAETALGEAIAVARGIGNQGLVAQSLNFQGENALFRGDAKAARQLFDQALKESTPTGDRYLVLLSTSNAANATLLDTPAAGRGGKDAAAKRAIDSLTEVGREADRRGFKYLALECSIAMAGALIDGGSGARAQRELERVAAQTEKLGLRELRAKAEHLLGHRAAARRLLIEIRTELRDDAILKRADLAPILQDR